MSARKLAVQLLNRTEQEQSYSNLLLDSALSQSQLDERDKRLCASLAWFPSMLSEPLSASVTF